MKFAFGGPGRSGKDTAAEYLEHKYGGRIMKFADPLYEILHFAQDTMGVPRQKDLVFLPWIGTDWARTHYNEDVWCKVFTEKFNSFQKLSKNADENYYVSDVRFLNELETVKGLGFTTVYIYRPDKPDDIRKSHPSETSVTNFIPKFDYVIHNDGSIKDLKESVDTLIRTVYGCG